jgi:Fe-S cluster biosynthesis and repair protein YggX
MSESAKLVDCVKLGKMLPALSSPPRNDDLGEKIFAHVSQQAWELWLAQQTILINHYGLNMVDPKAHSFLSEQMEQFFFGEGAQLPEDWVPEGQGDGGGEKGAPTGGGKGAPSGGGKGAPAPPQK